METVVRNPAEGVYPATDDYVHALEVRDARRLLFVSGTMGLEANGEPGATLERQLDLIWANIRTILASADMTLDNVVRLTSYLTDPAGACLRAGLQPEPGAEANAAARIAALGGRAIPTTAIVVQTLVSDWLVEIEVIAAA